MSDDWSRVDVFDPAACARAVTNAEAMVWDDIAEFLLAVAGCLRAEGMTEDRITVSIEKAEYTLRQHCRQSAEATLASARRRLTQ